MVGCIMQKQVLKSLLLTYQKEGLADTRLAQPSLGITPTIHSHEKSYNNELLNVSEGQHAIPLCSVIFNL